ncbi:acetyl-CoA carboxylase, carboxyltransferase subunit beta [Fusobacterium necrophorum subsp. funduliforme]|nr:acetyl-CoA carboxylase, carboxyltransferase subunit beta [Fusobacterium necrophorum]
MAFFKIKNLSRSRKKYATLTVETSEVEEKENREKHHTEKNEEKIESLWSRCPSCQEIIYQEDLQQNLWTCPNCSYHFSVAARQRIELLLDEGSFEEMDAEYCSSDPLQFPGYLEKYKETQEKENLIEGVICGSGKLCGIEVAIAVMDFKFMGGSMGSVVGEKIVDTMELGLQKKIPVIVVASSGGARMQEGILSLMQMAKTAAAAEKLKKAGIPFISIPVNPTTGGVTASFAMLGDIIMSEPKARIGFAGPRVIEQTIRQKLPGNFQKSEFLQEHGMVDIVVERKNMKETLYKILTNILGATNGI